ncbi:MAG: hypothetical protein P8M80_10680, partial [Pirellulaceae bacterium]|nr:hypothetical protein [Pirellulaceae bacterium]
MVIFTAGMVLSSEVGNFGGLLADDLQFAKNVRPILSDACYSCHGPDEKSREGDLRLDDRGAVMKADVLTSGTLLARLTSDDPDVRMPPVDSNRRLPDKDRKQLIR